MPQKQPSVDHAVGAGQELGWRYANRRETLLADDDHIALLLMQGFAVVTFFASLHITETRSSNITVVADSVNCRIIETEPGIGLEQMGHPGSRWITDAKRIFEWSYELSVVTVIS